MLDEWNEVFVREEQLVVFDDAEGCNDGVHRLSNGDTAFSKQTVVLGAADGVVDAEHFKDRQGGQKLPGRPVVGIRTEAR